MIIKLIPLAIFPVIVTVLFLLLEDKTSYKKLNYWQKQILVGLSFGILACLATQFGVTWENSAVVNVRNAAPLSAGLVFGGPAGLIASVIGAVYRYASTLWGMPEYTKMAGVISILLAGMIGAFCHKFVMENKRFSLLYGFVIGAISEVIHMLLVFLTQANDTVGAFTIIENIALPMISVVGVSIAASLYLMTLFERKNHPQNDPEKKSVSDAFQLGLFFCSVIGLIFSGLFTFTFETRMAVDEAHENLLSSIKKTDTYFDEFSSFSMWSMFDALAYPIHLTALEGKEIPPLQDLVNEYIGTGNISDLLEIGITDYDGIYLESTEPSLTGQKINPEFWDFVQKYRSDMEIYSDEGGLYVKYYDEGFLFANYFIGNYDPEDGQYIGRYLKSAGIFLVAKFPANYFEKTSYDQVLLDTPMQYTSQNGYMLLVDQQGRIIDRSTEQKGFIDHMLSTMIGDFHVFSDCGIEDASTIPTDEVSVQTLYEEECYCASLHHTSLMGDYYILSLLPTKEVAFTRNASLYISLLMQAIVFALIYAIIYRTNKSVVIDKIKAINTSLSKITEGDLNEQVQVREFQEFNDLSDDINTTVKALKQLIDKEASRIDQDLANAKAIQHSSMPLPLPKQKEFEICASMDAAKEVGGDFYDYYFLDEHHFAFLIADVSGKGIPAALFMMNAKSLIKNMIEHSSNIAEAFFDANNGLCARNSEDMFITAWMGILDLRSGLLQYVNAGHNAPLFKKAGGTFEYLHCSPDFVLAGMEDMPYHINELQMEPGDELFLYTDGVTEAADITNRLYGEERLHDLCNAEHLYENDLQKMLQYLRQDIAYFAGEAQQADDITMMALRFKQKNSAD